MAKADIAVCNLGGKFNIVFILPLKILNNRGRRYLYIPYFHIRFFINFKNPEFKNKQNQSIQITSIIL